MHALANGILEFLWQGVKEAIPLAWPVLALIGCVWIVKMMIPRHIREGKPRRRRRP
jgi:hypothetical protein